MRVGLAWLTPYERMMHLRKTRDPGAWEKFRDLLMARWSNLNIICGLIMGAASTIVFSGTTLSRGSFALGIISLLSSLISIGVGAGMAYVLGDVPGVTLRAVNDTYPALYVYALSIPEIYAFLSFIAFFSSVGIIVWQSPEKGWLAKAGTVAAASVLGFHLLGFAWLFRERPMTEYLAAEHGEIPPGEPPMSAKTMVNESSSSYLDESPAQDNFENTQMKVMDVAPSVPYNDGMTISIVDAQNQS